MLYIWKRLISLLFSCYNPLQICTRRSPLDLYAYFERYPHVPRSFFQPLDSFLGASWLKKKSLFCDSTCQTSAWALNGVLSSLSSWLYLLTSTFGCNNSFISNWTLFPSQQHPIPNAWVWLLICLLPWLRGSWSRLHMTVLWLLTVTTSFLFVPNFATPKA